MGFVQDLEEQWAAPGSLFHDDSDSSPMAREPEPEPEAEVEPAVKKRARKRKSADAADNEVIGSTQEVFRDWIQTEEDAQKDKRKGKRRRKNDPGVAAEDLCGQLVDQGESQAIDVGEEQRREDERSKERLMEKMMRVNERIQQRQKRRDLYVLRVSIMLLNDCLIKWTRTNSKAELPLYNDGYAMVDWPTCLRHDRLFDLDNAIKQIWLQPGVLPPKVAPKPDTQYVASDREVTARIDLIKRSLTSRKDSLQKWALPTLGAALADPSRLLRRLKRISNYQQFVWPDCLQPADEPTRAGILATVAKAFPDDHEDIIAGLQKPSVVPEAVREQEEEVSQESPSDEPTDWWRESNVDPDLIEVAGGGNRAAKSKVVDDDDVDNEAAIEENQATLGESSSAPSDASSKQDDLAPGQEEAPEEAARREDEARKERIKLAKQRLRAELMRKQAASEFIDAAAEEDVDGEIQNAESDESEDAGDIDDVLSMYEFDEEKIAAEDGDEEAVAALFREQMKEKEEAIFSRLFNKRTTQGGGEDEFLKSLRHSLQGDHSRLAEEIAFAWDDKQLSNSEEEDEEDVEDNEEPTETSKENKMQDAKGEVVKYSLKDVEIPAGSERQLLDALLK